MVEILVHRPLDYALVLHRVGQGEGLQDAGGVLDDGVLDGLLVFFGLAQGVHFGQFAGQGLLHVVLPPLLPAEGIVPGFECGLGAGGGVGAVEGVEFGPVKRVAGLLEGVPHDDVGERVQQRHVVLVAEWVDKLK